MITTESLICEDVYTIQQHLVKMQSQYLTINSARELHKILASNFKHAVMELPEMSQWIDPIMLTNTKLQDNNFRKPHVWR